MALYNRPRDPHFDPNDPNYLDHPSAIAGTLLPLILAAAIAVAVIAMFYPRTTTDRVGDANNAGPAVQTVTPAPSPSTSPAVPTPNPTTEPRPTQAPIR
jgi:hypothetical protein